MLPAMGPIAVGGLGGSGTRALAALLGSFGVELGSDLNRAQDDRWFTMLFKPLSRRTSTLEEAQRLAARRLPLYTRIVRREPMTVRDRVLLADAALRVAIRGHDHTGRQRGSTWVGERLRLIRSPAVPDRGSGGTAWGWKEPNTHIFVPALLEHYPELRYIHLVRHGLDMAFSRNDTQLRLWAEHFGLAVPADDDLLAVSRLRYWSAANHRISELAQRHPDRCLVLRFEDVCREPREMAACIAEFCGLPVDEDLLDRAPELVREPGTVGRFRQHDVSVFDPADLEPLGAFGYDATPP